MPALFYGSDGETHYELEWDFSIQEPRGNYNGLSGWAKVLRSSGSRRCLTVEQMVKCTSANLHHASPLSAPASTGPAWHRGICGERPGGQRRPQWRRLLPRPRPSLAPCPTPLSVMAPQVQWGGLLARLNATAPQPQLRWLLARPRATERATAPLARRIRVAD
jgi:hypothetical protein